MYSSTNNKNSDQTAPNNTTADCPHFQQNQIHNGLEANNGNVTSTNSGDRRSSRSSPIISQFQQFTSDKPPVSSTPPDLMRHHLQYYPQHHPSAHFGRESPRYYPGTNNLQHDYPQISSVPTNTNIIYGQQQSGQNQLGYLQWLEQVQRGQQQHQVIVEPIKRPWWIWFIAWVDTIAALFYMVVLIYKIFTETAPDPGGFILQCFITSLAILIRFLMGVGLLNGLKSHDDSSTLWYCKIWVACQLIFLVGSVIGLVTCASVLAAGPSRANVAFRPAQDPYPEVTLLAVFLKFIYRVVTFILVRSFIGKLKKSEAMSLGGMMPYTGRQPPDDGTEQRHRFGTGESSFCGPSVALIMSL